MGSFFLLFFCCLFLSSLGNDEEFVSKSLKSRIWNKTQIMLEKGLLFAHENVWNPIFDLAIYGIPDNSVVPLRIRSFVSHRSCAESAEFYLRKYAPHCAGGDVPRRRVDSPGCKEEHLEWALAASYDNYISSLFARLKTFVTHLIPGVGFVRDSYQRLRFTGTAAHIYGYDITNDEVRIAIAGVAFDLDWRSQLVKKFKKNIKRIVMRTVLKKLAKEGAKKAAGTILPLGVLYGILYAVWPGNDPIKRAYEVGFFVFLTILVFHFSCFSYRRFHIHPKML